MMGSRKAHCGRFGRSSGVAGVRWVDDRRCVDRSREATFSTTAALADFGLVVFPVAASVASLYSRAYAAVALRAALRRHAHTLRYVVMQ